MSKPPTPPAQMINSSVLTIDGGQQFPVQVFRLASGSTVAIVSGVAGNTSLMNADEAIHEAVAQAFPNAKVLQCWERADDFGTAGIGGGYAWPDGEGGAGPADLDLLAAEGLDLRASPGAKDPTE